MLQVEKFTFNPFQENTYLVYDETKEAIIVDPGCFNSLEEQQLIEFVDQNELKVVKLFNTHAHIDHILGNAFVRQKFKVKLYAYSSSFPMLELAEKSAKMYQIPYTPSPEIDEQVKGGEVLKFGNSSMDILFVPGHAPDHLVLYAKEDHFIIGGDVLFRGSIGRTDLPGGDHNELIRNIQEKVFTLPSETIVYSGHGPETNIGYEKETNPFF